MAVVLGDDPNELLALDGEARGLVRVAITSAASMSFSALDRRRLYSHAASKVEGKDAAGMDLVKLLASSHRCRSHALCRRRHVSPRARW